MRDTPPLFLLKRHRLGMPSRDPAWIPAAWLMATILLAAVVLPRPLRAQEGCQALPASPAPVPPELSDPNQTVTAKYDSLQKVKDFYRMAGHVEITYRDAKVTADEATFDAASGELKAHGHVTFTDAGDFLEAQSVAYNLRAGVGKFLEVKGYVYAHLRPQRQMLTTSNPFFFQADRVERINEQVYKFDHGRVTSCSPEQWGWSLNVGHGEVRAGDKLISHNDLFQLLHIPLFYSPLLVVPINSKQRQSGILLPEAGNSSQKGYIIGEGFFWAISPSMDLTLGLADYTKRGVATSGRFRATPTESSAIEVDYTGVNDKAPVDIRAAGMSVHAVGHDDDLGYGFRGVVNVDYINSLAYRLTFTDNFTQAVTSEVRQEAFATKSFSAYSLNFYGSRYQNFLSASPIETVGNSIVIQQTPGFWFSGMDKQVGDSLFYFSFDTSAAGVARTQPGAELPLSERVDFYPRVTLRSRPFWGFHFTPTLGVRATRYGSSSRLGEVPINRGVGEFSADLRPPALEKVFKRTFAGYKIKHVIEPDIRYRLVGVSDKEDIDNIVRYDDVDIVSSTNELEYSLTNTLYYRKNVGDGEALPQAHELVSLRLSQKYYFDPNFGGALRPGTNVVFDPTISLTGFAFEPGRRLSPVVSVLKIAPFSNFDTEIRADLNPSGGGVLNAGITSHVKSGPLGLAFTDFFVNRTESLLVAPPPSASLSSLQSFNLLRTVVTYGDASTKGLSGAVGLDYNIAKGLTNQLVGQASYNFGCFGLNFEYRRFNIPNLRQENSFRVALSLANVTTVGNLRPRERLYSEP